MKWLINAYKGDAGVIMAKLCADGKGLSLFVADPKATETYTVNRLKRMGAVGIYERTTGGKVVS